MQTIYHYYRTAAHYNTSWWGLKQNIEQNSSFTVSQQVDKARHDKTELLHWPVAIYCWITKRSHRRRVLDQSSQPVARKIRHLIWFAFVKEGILSWRCPQGMVPVEITTISYSWICCRHEGGIITFSFQIRLASVFEIQRVVGHLKYNIARVEM